MLDLCHKIAQDAHKRQVRWGGEPYFENHILPVVAKLGTERRKCIAYLHDTLEDTHLSIEALITLGVSKDIVSGVVLLTHKKGESYAEYIWRISEASRVVDEQLALDVIAVKIADLEHNSSDLNPKKDRQRLEKYELARMLLKSRYYEIPHASN